MIFFVVFFTQKLWILYTVYTGQPKAQYFFTNISICTFSCVSFSFFCILFSFQCDFHLHSSTSPKHGGTIINYRCSSPSKVFSLSGTWHNEVVVPLNNRVSWCDRVSCGREVENVTSTPPPFPGRGIVELVGRGRGGGFRLFVGFFPPSLRRF